MKRGVTEFSLFLFVVLLLGLTFMVGRGGITGLQVSDEPLVAEESQAGVPLEQSSAGVTSPVESGGLRASSLELAPVSSQGQGSGSGAGISGGIGISTDITTCQNLAITDTYTLTQNISSQSNCFNISANNVTLNCQGNTILYANATEAAGIFVNAFNASVLNCRVEQINQSLGASHGISMSGADGAIIVNNTVITNGTLGGSPSNAIRLVGGTDNGLFLNNTFVALSQGNSVNVDSSLNNTFYNITAFANSSGGFGFTSASTDNRVWNSYGEVAGSNSGLSAAGSSDNLSVINGTFISGTGGALSLISSNSHNLANNTVQGPFGLQMINSANNVINETRVVAGTGIGVRFFGAGSTGNVLRNTTISTNNTWIFVDATSGSASFTNTTFNSVSGAVEVTPAATIPAGANVSVFSLNTSANNSFLNSSNLTFLNLSGRFTLRSVFFVDPSPLIDAEDDGTYVDCTGPTCAEDSYSGGAYVVNVTHFTSYAATGEPLVTDCQNLTAPGEYVLANSISAGGTCINATSNNVTLDCDGFTILYATLGAGVGVDLTGRTNATVKNCLMVGGAFASAHGILVSTASNVTVQNNSINTSGNPSSPIRLLTASASVVSGNLVFAQNAAFTSTGAIYVSGGSNNDVSNNYAVSAGGSGIFLDGGTTGNRFTNNDGIAQDSGSGVTVSGVSSNNFTNLTAFSVNQPGVLMTSATGNRFVNSRLMSKGHSGLFAAASSLTVIDNVTALSNASQAFLMLNSGSSSISRSIGYGGFAGLQFSGAGMGNANVSDSLFAANDTTGSALTFFTDAGSNNFRNVTFATNGTWISNNTAGANNNFTNTTFNATLGSIRFNGTFTLGGTVNLRNLSVGQNFAFLNSTNLSFLNATAQVVLRNVTFVSPIVKVDQEDDGTFVTCSAGVCAEQSFALGEFVFNVSHFTNYSLSETAINYCPVTINDSSILTQNVSAGDTCVTFGADDIELDCAGFTIQYSNTSAGAGVNASGRRNVTVRNCQLVQGNPAVTFVNGVLFTAVNDSLVTNTTSIISGDGGHGFMLASSSKNNTVQYVSSIGNASFGDFGVYVASSSNNNTVQHGRFVTNGTSSSGIVADGLSGNNTFLNNSAQSNISTAIVIDSSSNNTLTNNTALSNSSVGISLQNIGADRNVLTGNRAESNTSVAIRVLLGHNNTLANNTGSSVGGAAIQLSGANNNSLTNNTGASTSGIGISLSDANSSVLINNTAMSNSNVGLQLSLSLNNILVNNSGASASQMGIELTATANNNTLYLDRGTSVTFSGIHVLNSQNNNLISVTGTSSASSGIRLTTASMNNITSSNGSSTSFYGIHLGGGAFNRVVQSRATSESNDGIYLTGGSAQNVLDNNTFQSNTDGAVGFGAAGSQNNNFTNNTLQANVSWIMLRETSTTGNLFANTFFDTVGGVVQIQNFTLPNDKNITFVSFNISQNRTFLNSSNLTFLNQSANITLRNISFGNPRAAVDENDTNVFITCPSSRCTPISYSGGAFTFNVSGFTSYAVSDAGGVALTKTDSPDPVVKGALLSYQITINNTNNVSVFNVSLSETYPAGVAFVSSIPVPSAGNGTFNIGTLAANTSTTVNITVRAGSNLANGTTLNNTVNISSRVANGTQSQVNISEQTAIRGIAGIQTAKTDTPDPVPRGATLTYQITVTNSGDEIAYNVTVVEGYPSNTNFNGSAPAPSSGNNTFAVGNLSPGESTTINITINASSLLANASVLTNSYNLTFQNVTGASETVQNSTTTTVLGSPDISAVKTESADPVFAGDSLVYAINVMNSGDDTAFNITVIEGYPAGVSFVSGQPTPAGNNTFTIASLAPSASFQINITVTVSGSLPNGTILNNTINATFTNRSGQVDVVNASELTTVIGSPFLTTNKTVNQSVVIKGQTVNYTITVNNTGTSTAFNVTVFEGYPSGVVFISAQPNPTTGNHTWNLGTLLPNESATINITINTSVTLTNGTILNNSYNTTLNRTDGRSVNASSSAAVTVQGSPTITVTKFDSPDPVLNGSQLNYTIAVTNTGDEIAYNITVVEGYDPNVVFHNSTPVPISGNNVFALGNLLPGQTTTLNITVNVSPAYFGLINNSVNVTFTNLSGVNETRAAVAQTTVVAVLAVPAGQGGGSGGSGSGSNSVAGVSSMTGNFLSMYLRKNDKVKFSVAQSDHELTVLEVLLDGASVRVASVPQEFIIRKGAVQAVDVTGDGQADLRISVSDVVYDRALFMLEKTAFSPAVKAEYVAPEVKEALNVPPSQEVPMSEPARESQQESPSTSQVQGEVLRPTEEQQSSLFGLLAIGFAGMLVLIIGVSLFSGVSRRNEVTAPSFAEKAELQKLELPAQKIQETPRSAILEVQKDMQMQEQKRELMPSAKQAAKSKGKVANAFSRAFSSQPKEKPLDSKSIDSELRDLQRKIKKLK